jgi:protein phosphatase
VTSLRAGAATDIGMVRANNQDQLLLAAPVFAVADGMGGHAAGEVASLTAVDALRAAFEHGPVASPQALAEAARAANRAVWDTAQTDAELYGMGTTLTALALVPDGAGAETVAVVNVGDSRTYRFSDGDLEQVTLDHSYVAELVAEGRIDEAEAEVHPQRHVLTRALGVAPDVDVDLLVIPPVPGDRYVLCSDGLSREVTDAQVAALLRRLSDPGDAARELVATAKLHGGSDNITVVVVDVVADGPDAPAAVAPGPATEVLPSLTAADLARSPAERTPDPEKPGVPEMPEEPAGDAAPDAGAPVVLPATGTSEADPDEPGPVGRRERRRAAKAAREPRARLVTVRVVAFVVALVAIVVVAGLGTAYYARRTYYVGLRGGQVVIFKGRPGGVLWWQPTTAEVTGLSESDVLSYNLPALRAGEQESSLRAARAYVGNLRAEKAAASSGTANSGTASPATTSTGQT